MIWPLAVQGPRVPLSLVFTPLNSKLAEAKTGGVPCECNALTWVGAPPHDFTVGLSASLNKSSTLRSSTRPEQQHALLPLTRTSAPLPSRHTHVQRIPSTCNGNILLSEMSLPLTCLGAPPPSRPRPPWRPRPAHARTQSLLRQQRKRNTFISALQAGQSAVGIEWVQSTYSISPADWPGGKGGKLAPHAG